MPEKYLSDLLALGHGPVDVGEVKASVEVALQTDVVAEAVKSLVTWKDVAEEHEILVAWRFYLLAVYTKGVLKAASLALNMITTVD